jgi:FkbM family methyltransferase
MAIRTQMTSRSAEALFSSIGLISTRLSGRLCRRWTRLCSHYPNWLGMPEIRLVASTRVGTVSCDPRDGVQSTLIERGEWEPTVSETICRILKPNDVFVDIGANIGYFSLLAAQVVGEEGLVLAFEPLPETLERLLDTCRRNQADNVLCLGLALNDSRRLVTLHLSDDGQVGLTSMRAWGTRTRRVLSCRLDEVIEPALFKSVKLIKVDVEGAEMNVIQGMTKLFADGHRPYVICEVTDAFLRSCGASADALVEALASYGYELFATDRQAAESWTPLDVADLPTEQFDMLCVPPGEDATPLLTSAQRQGCPR